MLNKVSIMGRLTRDPELKTTASSISVTSFSIACDRNFKEKGSNDYATDFFEITAWRKTAEHICNYFRKGALIAIDGTLQTRSYVDKSNVTHKVVEIVADNVFFCEKKNADVNASADIPAYGEPPMAYAQQPAGYAAPTDSNPFTDNEFNNAPVDFYPEFK